MRESRLIAAIVGPTLTFMALSELKLWNPHLYDTQIVPLVYLSGVLFFVAGLAIICKHSVWLWTWQTLLTITGWLGVFLGLARMFFPQAYLQQFKNDNSILMIEILLISLGIYLTFKAYIPIEKKN